MVGCWLFVGSVVVRWLGWCCRGFGCWLVVIVCSGLVGLVVCVCLVVVRDFSVLVDWVIGSVGCWWFLLVVVMVVIRLGGVWV